MVAAPSTLGAGMVVAAAAAAAAASGLYEMLVSEAGWAVHYERLLAPPSPSSTATVSTQDHALCQLLPLLPAGCVLGLRGKALLRKGPCCYIAVGVAHYTAHTEPHSAQDPQP